MRVYRVGGSVRDELLGLPVQDRDYVVVGATPAEMDQRGFKPVGNDFPVFLHPETHEEYALARTERKTSRGYKGFSFHAAPDVTLEDDLARRDLTINAIAQDEAGRIIDPFGGAADLKRGVLRHVSPAFVEDPVRILRVARFAARFGFSIAPETAALMREMVANGEVDALVPERVWQELAKGLMEAAPRRMFEVLAEAGALTRVLPEWTKLDSARALGALAIAAERGLALPVRYAALFAGGDAKSPSKRRFGCERRPIAASLRSSRRRPPHALRNARALDAARSSISCSEWTPSGDRSVSSRSSMHASATLARSAKRMRSVPHIWHKCWLWREASMQARSRKRNPRAGRCARRASPRWRRRSPMSRYFASYRRCEGAHPLMSPD